MACLTMDQFRSKTKIARKVCFRTIHFSCLFVGPQPPFSIAPLLPIAAVHMSRPESPVRGWDRAE